MPKYQESFTFTAIGIEPNQETFDQRIWEIFMPVLDVQLKAYGYELFYKPKRNDYTKSNPCSHSTEIKEETSMLKMEDIKEGDVLIALSNDIATFQFTIGKEYKVSKQYDYLTVTPNYGCVMYIKSLHDSCNYSERLKHFKLKQKETTMLNPEIYAVGTVHKSISDFYSYKIIARDITFDDKLYMLTHDINSKNDTMLVSQETGKAITPDISYDLAITKKKIKGWINIKKRDKDTYKWRHAFMYDTKEQAINDRLNPNDYIACIEVEFEGGEGL